MAPTRRIAALLLLQHAAALAPPVVKAADVAASGLASMARMPVAAGKSTTVVEGLAAYPAFRTPPVLYEFEACPYCRFVREAVTALDLVVDVKPCGRGSRHRAEARKLGGKEQFPLLVDGDTVLYESADIVDYLAAKRGVTLAPPTGGVLASAAATAFRPGRGDAVSAGALAKPPRKLLELYSYEGNQFCRLVREVLCELDLQYPVWKLKFYGAFTPSTRRLLDGVAMPVPRCQARTAASSPRNDLVENYRAPDTLVDFHTGLTWSSRPTSSAALLGTRGRSPGVTWPRTCPQVYT